MAMHLVVKPRPESPLLDRIGFVRNEHGDYYNPSLYDYDPFKGKSLANLIQDMYFDWLYWAKTRHTTMISKSYCNGRTLACREQLDRILRMLHTEWAYQHGCGD